MLRDPKVTGDVVVESNWIHAGQLPLSVVDDLNAQLKEPDTSGEPRRANLDSPDGRPPVSMDKPQRDPVRVLVAPYLLTAVTLPSRARQGNAIPPFWIPALLMPNGELQPDPEHLPFVPRALLDPPIGDRLEHWPTPIASWDEYDRRIRVMLVDRQEDWTARLHHAEEMFHKVADITVAEWLQSLPENCWQRERPVIVPWANQDRSARLILPLCEGWLEKDLLAGTLMRVVSPTADHSSAIETLIVADQWHLGHSGERPLNQKQRDAVRAVRLLKEGQVQAVNGPPGTGKTSLIKTLIADAVVNAAIAGADPPRIIVTSTNNQALRNVLEGLTSPDNDRLSDERKRWLPKLMHLAAFNASAEQAKDSEGLLLLRQLDAQIFSAGYADDAERYFLERFKAWRSSSGAGPLEALPREVNLTWAEAALKEQLHKVVATIKAKATVVAKAEELVAKENSIRGCYEQLPATIVAVRSYRTQAEADASAAKQTVSNLNEEHKEAIETLGNRAKPHPLWMRWFSFLPPVEARRAELLRQAAIALQYLPKDDRPLGSMAAVHNAVDAEFAARKAASAIQAQGLEEARNVWTDLERWLAEYVDPKAADAFDAARRRIDVDLRTRAFSLAMRMREAQFLLRRGEWDQRWISTENKGRQGSDSRPELLKTYAYVVPCVAATVYKAAGHCCFYDGKIERPMELPIDLLIYDEAGQVAPDLGLPLLGLARRAVAVGDVHQLEPIERFNEASDDRLLQEEGFEEKQWSVLRGHGLTHVRGSVMRAFQRATAHSDKDVKEPGVLLRHHFRCVPKIIRYCNDLVYNGQLIPDRPDEEAPWIAPMSWAHVRGDARKVRGSWDNQPEAEAIARWLAANRETIKKLYNSDLNQAVAVLTPYGSQTKLLREALRRHVSTVAGGITIGTVHSLQGDECPLVVFSPTVTRMALDAAGTERPFFDTRPSILNVAVSRAMNAFVVIGDMGLFDRAGQPLPSTVLARHLFTEPTNELLDVLPAVAVTSLEGTQRINGTAEHRRLLVRAFEMARSRLLIASPFLTQGAIEADNVTALIRRATKKQKVDVVVYSGSRTSKDDGSALKALAAALEDAGARVLLTTRLHAKTLACDESLVVEGSFNWLSASRDPTRAKKETSFAVWGPSAQPHAAAIEAEFAALNAVPPEEFAFVS